MLYTPPRSNFHHTVLSGELSPISFVFVHDNAFLSTAFLALLTSGNSHDTRLDCEAALL